MFLPVTKEEMDKLGWQQCDVILVTGDAYIDSPYSGAAVIGHVLLEAGFKVGVIAQPNILSGGAQAKVEGPGPQNADIARLGEPRLFWGVTGGCVDSMVSNFTALKKPRRSDDFTPGGENNKRPNRAVIAYSNLIKHNFKNTRPIVLGGIEASLRRMAHYDYWQDGIRKSILFDSKADFLIYGMGEKAVVELAKVLDETENLKLKTESGNEESFQKIKGLCYISNKIPEGYIELPSFDAVIKDKAKFIEAFGIMYDNNDPGRAKGLAQKQDTRYLIQNPPADNLTAEELDKVHELPYEYDAHPYYAQMGHIKALDTIKFSITSHRGCYGECNFCAITSHQGRIVTSRSEASILREVEKLAKLPGFTGNIYDVGGPTANMYGISCSKIKGGHCGVKNCLYPKVCDNLANEHERQIKLLEQIRAVKGVKKVFIGSGIRHDMVVADKKYGEKYLRQVVEHHVSGQIKLAPEHSREKVLKLMRKPGIKSLLEFKDRYYMINGETGKKQFLTYYIIAAHPGCEERDMRYLKEFLDRELKAHPEQVQVFTPAPGTWSSVMYWTEMDPFTGTKVFVEKTNKGKERQKKIIKPE